jgi:glycosyltransferase involved in cell wall biosynthesis
MSSRIDDDIVLVYDAAGDPYDGIAAYTRNLAAALSDAGIHARIASHRDPEACRASTVVVQYNPFSYARWGFAPGLVLTMARCRRTKEPTRIGAMVHEPFVAPTGAASLLMSAWQRIQLAAVKRVAQFLIAPSADAARRTAGRGPSPRVVPVGSNIPDGRHGRAGAREALGVGPDDVVLVTFAHSGAGREPRHVVAAASESAGALGSGCHLLLLGAAAPLPEGLDSRVAVHLPGPLSDADLASHLAAGDVFLATYLDGVSTRRTSLISALQHGLAVVGTTVGRSDSVLLDDPGLIVVGAGDIDGFARAVARLVADGTERAQRGSAARALYERAFSWDVVAQAILEAA